jgi:hypothetical protein
MSDNSDLQAIIKIFRDGSSEEKNDVLEKILKTKDCSLILPMIENMEEEKNRSVKERTLMVLVNLVPMESYRSIDRMLRSPDPFVRNGAVEIIKRSDKPIIEFFKNLADDPDKDVRKFVIDSLAYDISDESTQIIRNRLDDTELNIIYTAIEHLGNLKDKKSFEKIEQILLSTNNFMVECSALEALPKIGFSPRSAEIMKKYSESENSMIVFPFLKYLERFGAAENLPYIIKVIEKNNRTYLKESIDAIRGIITRSKMTTLPEMLKSALEEILNSGINEVDQYEIRSFMNRVRGDDAKTEARNMLESDKEMVVLAGIEILADCGDKEDIEILEDLAEKFEESDEILEAVGDAVMKIDERLG